MNISAFSGLVTLREQGHLDIFPSTNILDALVSASPRVASCNDVLPCVSKLLTVSAALSARKELDGVENVVCRNYRVARLCPSVQRLPLAVSQCLHPLCAGENASNVERCKSDATCNIACAFKEAIGVDMDDFGVDIGISVNQTFDYFGTSIEDSSARPGLSAADLPCGATTIQSVCSGSVLPGGKMASASHTPWERSKRIDSFESLCRRQMVDFKVAIDCIKMHAWASITYRKWAQPNERTMTRKRHYENVLIL